MIHIRSTGKFSYRGAGGAGSAAAIILVFILLLNTTTQQICAASDSGFGARAQSPGAPSLVEAQKEFDEAETLRREGSAESLRAAARKYEETIRLWRGAGDRRREGLALNRIGAIYNDQGQKQKAIAVFSRALRLAGEDRGGKAAALTGIGLVYSDLGEKRAALKLFDQALPLRREAGDPEGEAITLSAIAWAYSDLGDKKKAANYFSRAYLSWRAAGDPRGEALRLTGMGLISNDLGEKRKAIEFCEQALPIWRSVGERRGEAATILLIGRAYNDLGETEKALEFLNNALDLWRAIGHCNGESATLNSLGNVYSQLGDKQRALVFYIKALSLRRKFKDRRGEAVTLNNIAEIRAEQGEKRDALRSLFRALSLRRAVGDLKGEAETLTAIGEIHSALGEKRKALASYNQSLSLRRKVGDRRGEALTLSGIASVHNGLGKKQKADDLYNQALRLWREVRDPNGEADALYNIARNEYASGRFEESLAHIEASIKITESLRTKVSGRKMRASFFAAKQDNYEFYIHLLMRLHQQDSTKGYDAAALRASESARARSLLEGLTERRVALRLGADPQLLEQERALQQRLNLKADVRWNLLNGPHSKDRIEAVEKEIEFLMVEMEQVQAKIRQASPRYASLTQPAPLTVAEIQQQAMDADTLMLEYSLGKERSFLWAVTQTGLSSYELPKGAVISIAANKVYHLMAAPGRVIQGETAIQRLLRLAEAAEQYKVAAAELSRILLGPVAKQLDKTRLVIIADGVLPFLPFCALPSPNTLVEKAGDRRFLIEEHEITYLPSASSLAVIRRESATRQPAPGVLAVLADAVFSKDDGRIKVRPGRNEQKSSQLVFSVDQKRILKQIAKSPTSAPGEPQINRLLFTRPEAERIMAFAPPGSSMLALDFDASRATATSDLLSRYRYLHFATHGLIDSERPEFSAIVLSLYDSQGGRQDGFLRAHEIFNLNLPAEMVVLSACESGLGKQVRGEGLMSLTRGFMYAGALRVVVSSWSVSDQGTSELMPRFYRKILVEGYRPAAALRAAQIEMMREKRWESPYYWAGFALQGEWR